MEGEPLPAAHHLEIGFGALRASHITRHGAVVDGVAHKGVSVGHHEAVAPLHTHPFGHAAVVEVYDDHRVADDIEGHADADEVALKGLVGTLDVFGGDVEAMGVENTEHAADGLVGEALGVGVLDVVVINQPEHLIHAVASRDGVGRGTVEEIAEKLRTRGSKAQQQECKKDKDAFHRDNRSQYRVQRYGKK